jgi:hypothetical protein
MGKFPSVKPVLFYPLTAHELLQMAQLGMK